MYNVLRKLVLFHLEFIVKEIILGTHSSTDVLPEIHCHESIFHVFQCHLIFCSLVLIVQEESTKYQSSKSRKVSRHHNGQESTCWEG